MTAKKTAKKLLIANWKSNPATLEEAVVLAKKEDEAAALFKSVDLVVAPPFIFLEAVSEILKNSVLGAQDVFWEKSGPHTGEVSTDQLKNIGVQYVIVGHSEKRQDSGETDEMINKKIKGALAAGFRTVLCVGETSREDKEIPSSVGEQLVADVAGLKKDWLKNLIIAYEPVWAISTRLNSRPDTPSNVLQASLYIKKTLARTFGLKEANQIKVIYGGSVKTGNVASFLKDGGVSGALVGGASLNAEELIEIAKIANSQ